MSEETKDRIKRLLIQNVLKNMNAADLDDDASLIDLGVGLDSVATLELVVALEEEFQVSIDEGEITSEVLESVNTIQAYLDGKS
jgi:acyl carrier protein